MNMRSSRATACHGHNGTGMSGSRRSASTGTESPRMRSVKARIVGWVEVKRVLHAIYRNPSTPRRQKLMGFARGSTHPTILVLTPYRASTHDTVSCELLLGDAYLVFGQGTPW